jgi:glycosyltransferase involved in cell wall biosynthesis
MRILFLQKRPLFPVHDGGKVRTLNILRYLARWHDITYLCNLQTGEEQHLPQMQALGLRTVTVPWREVRRGSVAFYRDLALNLLSRYPYTACKDYHPALRARLAALLNEVPFDLLVCDFVQTSRNVLGLKTPPKVLFQHNVEAEIFERHARLGPGRLRRRYMAIQARKMRAFEAEAGRQFDAVIAVSGRDRHAFESAYGWDHVSTIDTGVGPEYFEPAAAAEHPRRVLYVGSMDWLANQDAAVYFVREVWPLVRHCHPTAEFQIVGRNPGPAVRCLADVPGVEVTGTVPDVRRYLAEAAVVVVPLLVGSGTRNKIFEAMAMGKAVVSTTLGAEGLPVAAGEHLLLADTPSDFAGAVDRLLDDPGLRARLGAAARALVYPRYAAENVARQFEDICVRTVDRARRRPVPAEKPLGAAAPPAAP